MAKSEMIQNSPKTSLDNRYDTRKLRNVPETPRNDQQMKVTKSKIMQNDVKWPKMYRTKDLIQKY